MHPHRSADERAFADTEELPIVADPDLCDEEPEPEGPSETPPQSQEEMPDTVPDGSLFRSVAAGQRRGDLVIE
jgi:hypothetical protein